MPHERREIIFSMSEFLDALMRYNEMRGGLRYQNHQIRQIGVDSDQDGVAELTFDDGEIVKFSDTDILASLIAYCIEHQVPLPARAGKKVVVKEDSVELAIESKTDWVRPIKLPMKFRQRRGR
ncbi:MAG: hypothetical protein COA62_01425 [Rhodobiaceae bacterium]|nr:MAG: hypothetical protein COA62_01425 [Rhodobiaceae bacterium]